jgi:hypothetical protein
VTGVAAANRESRAEEWSMLWRAEGIGDRLFWPTAVDGRDEQLRKCAAPGSEGESPRADHP